jgi:hypothetical protein
MPCLGFEPTTPVIEWAKTIHVLDCAATVSGTSEYNLAISASFLSEWDLQHRAEIYLCEDLPRQMEVWKKWKAQARDKFSAKICGVLWTVTEGFFKWSGKQLFRVNGNVHIIRWEWRTAECEEESRLCRNLQVTDLEIVSRIWSAEVTY